MRFFFLKITSLQYTCKSPIKHKFLRSCRVYFINMFSNLDQKCKRVEFVFAKKLHSKFIFTQC